jgi:hypothetical protein
LGIILEQARRRPFFVLDTNIIKEINFAPVTFVKKALARKIRNSTRDRDQGIKRYEHHTFNADAWFA